MTEPQKQILKKIGWTLLVAVGAVGGSLVLGRFFPTTSVDLAPKPSEIEIDPLAGWPVFTSIRHGFSIRLPQGYTMIEDGLSSYVMPKAQSGANAEPVMTITILSGTEPKNPPEGSTIMRIGGKTYTISPNKSLPWADYAKALQTIGHGK